jgi:hypothetical protein
MSNWHELCLEGVLVSGHNTHSFVHELTAKFVSAANLIWECPRSLLTALADKHPDRDIWMRSFWEEKDTITSMDIYNTITLAQYCALREKGALRAIPTMCILTLKPDKMMNPHCAKSCIVVLGNHKDRIWLKPDKYTPILHPYTMRLIVSIAVERQRTLQQGNCRNAFCQGILPPDIITIVKTRIGDPDAKKDEYWLLKRKLYGPHAALNTGTSRSNPSLKSSDSVKTQTARASLVATLLIPLIPLTLHRQTHSLLDSMLTTLFTSLSTLWWRPNSNVY